MPQSLSYCSLSALPTIATEYPYFRMSQTPQMPSPAEEKMLHSALSEIVQLMDRHNRKAFGWFSLKKIIWFIYFITSN